MSFKYGYMAQERPYAPGSQTPAGMWQWGKKRGSGAAYSACPLPHIFFNFRPLAMRAVQRLDRPASRDQINDRDN
jgi:hypothetical protein